MDTYGTYNPYTLDYGVRLNDDGTTSSMFSMPNPDYVPNLQPFTSVNNFTGTQSSLPAGIPAYQPMYPTGGSAAPTGSFGFGSGLSQNYQATPNNHWLNQANQRGQQVSSNYQNMTQPVAPTNATITGGLLGWGLK